MNVVVAEYANDVPQAAGNQSVTVDGSSMAIKVEVEQTTVVVTDVPINVSVDDLIVTVNEGTQGPQGPQGPPGTGHPEVYLVSNISSWNQVHGFNYLPEVRLVDVTGQGVDVGVEYPDANTVFIEFPVPYTGTIILS